MKHLFILNPRAGRESVFLRIAAEVKALCLARKKDCAFCILEDGVEIGDVIRSACAEAAGEEIRIYAGGGDGTFGNAVNAAAYCPNASVGVLPIGTGNDFVRNFGERAPFLDLEAQLDGRELQLDLLCCNDRLCANMVNIGFDCEAAREAGRMRRSKFIGEKLAYISGVLMTLIRKPGVTLSAAFGGEAPTDHKLLLLAIANGSFCGGGFRAAPKSVLDDGIMDVLMVENISRTRFLRLVKYYHDGTYLDLEGADQIIHYLRGDRLSLRFPATRSVCFDGEICEVDHLDISVKPGALRFILPRGAVWREEKRCEAAPCL